MATPPSRLFGDEPPSEGAIVLLEDDPADVFFVRRAFAHAQFANAILSFADADDVRGYLDETRQARPALFILDVHLASGETGIAFLHWLRQQRLPLGGTPVMMLTGSKNPDDRDEAAMLGSIYYLHKPVTSASLIAAVEALGFLVRRIAGPTPARVIERP